MPARRIPALGKSGGRAEGKAKSKGGPASDDKNGQDEAAPQGTSLLEWLIAAAGGVLLLGAIVYMTWYGLAHPPTPPQLSVEITAIVAAEGDYLVRFTARNAGNSTAAGVLVSGELGDGDATLERGETTLDYVPEHSAREGALMFQHDPRTHTLHLRVEGFHDP
jgi:uncharacterized protein (TIGR02588 family)